LGRTSERMGRSRLDDDRVAGADRMPLAVHLEDERPGHAGEGLLLCRVDVFADESPGADEEIGLEQLPVRVVTGPAEDPPLAGRRIGDLARAADGHPAASMASSERWRSPARRSGIRSPARTSPSSRRLPTRTGGSSGWRW